MATTSMVKPSSPTPPHLQNLPLSFLDQLAPPIYIHVILYFHRRPPTDHLTQSLSDTLSAYYPLAGRIRPPSSKTGPWVDCNDAGAEYVQQHIPETTLATVLTNPCLNDVNRYVPVSPSGGSDIPLAVQVNFFGCGGMAVGICMSHLVADATSAGMFVKAWAAACRGETDTAVDPPSFGSSSRFPPVDFSRVFSPGPAPPSPPPSVKVVSRRFVFDDRKLSVLRMAVTGPSLANPTRVEAVSTFIWLHFIKSKAAVENKTRVFAATHIADIRYRAAPAMPSQYIGNACGRTMAVAQTVSSDENMVNYYDLAMKLRSAIRRVDADYVRRLENSEEFLKHISVSDENDPEYRDGKKNLEVVGFTSWCRLPAYEADFGQGTPAWVSTITMPAKNLVTLLATASGNGIEAWVNMAEEDVAAIQRSYNLLHQILKGIP